MIYGVKLLAALAACLASVQAVTLWPQPVKAVVGTTSIPINAEFSWHYGGQSPILLQSLEQHRNVMKGSCTFAEGEALTGCKISVANEDAPLQYGVDESYELSVEGTECTIAAETIWGAMHAMETLTQLVVRGDNEHCRKSIASPVEISDYPRFSHRGVLVDTSRHYLPLEDIEKIIDAMAQNKMNVFHWHLVDAQSFPFDAPSAPQIVKGAYLPYLTYSTSDLQYVVSYGKSKGVRVMIELDIPGHAASWGVGYPNIVANCPSKSANINNIPLNPALQDTYDVLQNVLNDVTAHAFDGFVHLGGDEVVYSCWAEDATIAAWKTSNGYASWDDVYCDFIDKADAMVRGSGRTPVHWEETFLASCPLPADTIIQVWIDQETIANVTAAGFPTIAAPQEFWYLDHLSTTWDVMYTYEPSTDLSEAQQANLMGGETCSWGETVDNTMVHSRIWPRAAAVAERLWSEITVDDVTSAKARLEVHRCRMKVRGIPSQPLGPGYCATDGL